MNNKVTQFLATINLHEKYAFTFQDNGYDEMDDIYSLTKEDLTDIGIAKIGHQKKILNNAAARETTNQSDPRSDSAANQMLAKLATCFQSVGTKRGRVQFLINWTCPRSGPFWPSALRPGRPQLHTKRPEDRPRERSPSGAMAPLGLLTPP